MWRAYNNASMSQRTALITSAIAVLAFVVYLASPSPRSFTAPAAKESGISGQVLLGPTCPVERLGDPNCASKGYQTLIDVFLGAETGALVATINSDEQGKFTATLSPGTYVIAPRGGSPLPRCESIIVNVSANAYATVELQCDTRIR